MFLRFEGIFPSYKEIFVKVLKSLCFLRFKGIFPSNKGIFVKVLRRSLCFLRFKGILISKLQRTERIHEKLSKTKKFENDRLK